MLDSTGKTPDGILGDVTYLCDFLNDNVETGFCDNLPEEAADLINIPVPRGNTMGYGSFEGSKGNRDIAKKKCSKNRADMNLFYTFSEKKSLAKNKRTEQKI